MRLPQPMLERLSAAASRVTRSRTYDFVIGIFYLIRWWWIPRNPIINCYIHDFHHDDEDRARHSHPWLFNISIVVEVGYIKITDHGSFVRKPGDVVIRGPRSFHRIVLHRDEAGNIIPARTVFLTGPRFFQWHFKCPKGLVHWKIFTNPEDYGQTGRGCGEMS